LYIISRWHIYSLRVYYSNIIERRIAALNERIISIDSQFAIHYWNVVPYLFGYRVAPLCSLTYFYFAIKKWLVRARRYVVWKLGKFVSS